MTPCPRSMISGPVSRKLDKIDVRMYQRFNVTRGEIAESGGITGLLRANRATIGSASETRCMRLARAVVGSDAIVKIWVLFPRQRDHLMIIDWHAHIYTPEEAADDQLTYDGKSVLHPGASTAVPWCWRIFSTPTKRRESTSAWSPTPPITCAASAARGRTASGAALDRRRCGGSAGAAQGHALLLRHHPALRRASLYQGSRTRGSPTRPPGYFHPFKPQGALPRRRRSASVLGTRRGPRRAGDDPSAASRLRRGTDEGIPARLEHRPAVRSVPGAWPADRARHPGRLPERQDRGVPRRRW